MIKEIKKITNKSLDLINSDENHLSIQLRLDGFSFCIHNIDSDEILALNDYSFEDEKKDPVHQLKLVKEVFSNEKLLSKKFKNVRVSHSNNLVTQVPKPFFEKENLAQYLQFSIKTLENDFITYDEVENSDIINVYIPFVNINNFLVDMYGPFIFKHASTVLIEGLLKEFKNYSSPCCFVNVAATTFEILVLKKQGLELYNSFEFQTKEDFIYYILFTIEQLKLNPEELELRVMGDIERDSELFNILYQYVRNVSFYNPQSIYDLLKNESPHSHYVLLNHL